MNRAGLFHFIRNVNHFLYACKLLRSARYWRTTEPEELEVAEERGKKEQARRFERLCYRALAEGLISLSKAAELLQKPIHEVKAELKGLRIDSVNNYNRNRL